MRISDWSSDVCSSDLWAEVDHLYRIAARIGMARDEDGRVAQIILRRLDAAFEVDLPKSGRTFPTGRIVVQQRTEERIAVDARPASRSEEHTSELQSLMRTTYADFSLTKKHNINA